MSTYLKFETSDGKVIQVDQKTMLLSKFVKGMLDDTIDDLDDYIDSATFTKIVEFCEHHKDDEPCYMDRMVNIDDINTIDHIDLWDYNFATLGVQEILTLTKAADFLNIEPLQLLCCKMMANMMRGKTVAEIRADWNIPNDFTPEEEARILEENEWIKKQ